jgi:hypothetical protein
LIKFFCAPKVTLRERLNHCNDNENPLLNNIKNEIK